MIEILNPTILIEKINSLILFLDTFMWRKIFTDYGDIKNLLKASCAKGSLIIAITNAIESELKQRNLYEDVNKICQDSIVIVPMGRISANQIIHSMLCFCEDKHTITLDWNLAISDVPVLENKNIGLKKIVKNLEYEMNLARNSYSGGKEELVSIFVDIERQIWKNSLRVYAELLEESISSRENSSILNHELYNRFFLTDYFTDLPCIVLLSYLLAYLLYEREIEITDIIDIYSISELMPYTTLFIMDKDQHNRIKKLQKDYPIVFNNIDKLCCLSSVLKRSTYKPANTLKSFLNYVSF